MVSYAEIFSNTWGIILVALFFGGSIFVHEFGHFLAAKMRGMKVLRFSIGFGPKVFSWKGKDGCEYAVSLLPLGGYVALPQLADMGAVEGMSAEDKARAQEFPPASCTDKVIVSAAGAFFNLLFAAALAAVVWAIGVSENADYKTTVIGFVPKMISNVDGGKIPSPAALAGLKIGDKIIAIDSHPVSDFMQIIERVAIGSGRNTDGSPKAEIRVERDGKIMNVALSPRLIRTNLSTGDEIRMIGVSPATTMRVGRVMNGSPAETAGLKADDIVKAADGVRLYSQAQLAEYLNALPDGAKISLDILRDGKEMKIEAFPKRVDLTRGLCALELPDGEGTLSFIEMSAKDEGSTIRLYSKEGELSGLENLRAGDTLYSAGGKDIGALKELNIIVNAAAANTPVKISLSGADYNLKDAFLPSGTKSRLLAPKRQMMLGYILAKDYAVAHPSIYAQFSDSISRTWNAISSLVNPQSDIGISSLAGPVDIGRVIYELSMTSFSLVLSFAVLLNVNLAILNMLPIPVLDGGHIVFAIIAKIRGKALPPSFFAGVQGAFSILFLALMAYVVYYGFMRWHGDSKLENSNPLAAEYYIKNIEFKNHE